jgi:hypothetical protein
MKGMMIKSLLQASAFVDHQERMNANQVNSVNVEPVI